MLALLVLPSLKTVFIIIIILLLYRDDYFLPVQKCRKNREAEKTKVGNKGVNEFLFTKEWI